MARLPLAHMLFTQGFGTRRVCAGLVQHGHVTVGGELLLDPHAEFEATGLRFTVGGVSWGYHEKAYVMLHKPAGIECSRKPSAYPGVYTLLPAPLRQRPNKGAIAGVQAVGRLDADSTGLLLLSDDGPFIHRMSSPRHHVRKVYEIGTKHPLGPTQVNRLLEGVVLDDDPTPVRALGCEVVGECELRLTIAEGKYHQVKRMIAAVGNRVERLHRSRIGGLALPPDLAPGEWRWLDEDQLAALQGR